MNLPKVVSSLVEAQNSFDSRSYVECFSKSAIVHDEGKTHRGKAEILRWIEDSNQKYRATLKPLSYEETTSENLLTAEVSGNFPGSPAVLKFHFTLESDLINTLNVTG